MKGLRALTATLVIAGASMLVPVTASAAPPTFTPLLEYGSGGETSLVASATITEGSAQYFEVWLSQQTGMPTDVQFESNPAGIDGSCSAGVQSGRGFVQCTPLTPVANAGTTLTTRFNLPAAYLANGGAEVTMIAPPGGFANTATVTVAGPNPIAGQPPGDDPCAKLREKVDKLKEKVDKHPSSGRLHDRLKKAKKKLKKCEEAN